MYKKILVVVFCLFFLSIASVSAEVSSTFPKNEAGISAYTKTEDINENNNVSKLAEAVAFLEALEGGDVSGETTYLTGKIPVKIEIEEHFFYVYPNIYLDLEGWIVAYFKEDVPTSKIIQWTGYTPENMSPTVLEEAIKIMGEGLALSYPTLKYYHFQYPEANRMTLIIDTIYGEENYKNNFSVVIPGTI